jgi:hypothetical protein
LSSEIFSRYKLSRRASGNRGSYQGTSFSRAERGAKRIRLQPLAFFFALQRKDMVEERPFMAAKGRFFEVRFSAGRFLMVCSNC